MNMLAIVFPRALQYLAIAGTLDVFTSEITTLQTFHRGVLHNASLYPEPFEFMPERYKMNMGGLNPDPRLYVFGYGRR